MRFSESVGSIDRYHPTDRKTYDSMSPKRQEVVSSWPLEKQREYLYDRRPGT